VQLCSGSARGMDGWMRSGLMDSKRMYVMALVISGGGGAGWGSGVSCLPGVGAWGRGGRDDERRRSAGREASNPTRTRYWILVFVRALLLFFFEQHELGCLPAHVVR
jgi:hypothetical protein